MVKGISSRIFCVVVYGCELGDIEPQRWDGLFDIEVCENFMVF